jgi:hypothetical protein
MVTMGFLVMLSAALGAVLILVIARPAGDHVLP